MGSWPIREKLRIVIVVGPRRRTGTSTGRFTYPVPRLSGVQRLDHGFPVSMPVSGNHGAVEYGCRYSRKAVMGC
jgi:hypothetical protein